MVNISMESLSQCVHAILPNEHAEQLLSGIVHAAETEIASTLA